MSLLEMFFRHGNNIGDRFEIHTKPVHDPWMNKNEFVLGHGTRAVA
jgi:hypothetical protein